MYTAGNLAVHSVCAAAKSCLENFLRSHDIRPREKDLLRVVKVSGISRAPCDQQ